MLTTILNPRSKIKIPDSPNPSNLGVVHLNLQDMAREIGVGAASCEATEVIGLGAENTRESGTDSSSSTPMISNPSVLFVEEILARMAIQVPGLEESLVQDVSTSKIHNLPVEERQLLRQKHKLRIQKATRPKPATMEAAKSMKELLEAWEAKAKYADITASILKKLAPPAT